MREGWVRVRLADVCSITKGSSPTEKTPPGPYPLVVTAAQWRTADTFQFDGEAVCIPTISSLGHGRAALHRVHYVNGRFALANLLVAAEVQEPGRLLARYLHLYLMARKDELIVPLMRGTANVSLKQRELEAIALDLPPLADQRRVVDLAGAMDDVSRCAIDQAQAALDLWSAVTSDLEHADRFVDLRSVALKAKAGATPSRNEPSNYVGDVPWLKSGEVDDDNIETTSEAISEKALASSSTWLMPAGTIVVAMYGQGETAGSVGYLAREMACNQAVLGVVPDPEQVDGRFLFHWLRSRKREMRSRRVGTSQPNLNKAIVLDTRVPVVERRRQRELADMLDAALEVARQSSDLEMSVRRLRQGLVEDLVTGRTAIPEAYDDLMEQAS